MKVLGIDPGREKCGMAMVEESGEVLYRKVLPTPQLWDELLMLVARHGTLSFVLGNGTGAHPIEILLREHFPELPITLADERMTTLDARARYWEIHPPRGLWKLVPQSLRVPPEPYDDCAALLLAERFLAGLD